MTLPNAKRHLEPGDAELLEGSERLLKRAFVALVQYGNRWEDLVGDLKALHLRLAARNERSETPSEDELADLVDVSKILSRDKAISRGEGFRTGQVSRSRR